MSACLRLWLNIIFNSSINSWLRLKASFILLSVISGNSLFRSLSKLLLNRTFDLVRKLLDFILSIFNVCSYESSNPKKNLKFRINSHHRLCQAQFEPCVELTDVCMPKVILTIRLPFSYEQERSLYLKIRYYDKKIKVCEAQFLKRNEKKTGQGFRFLWRRRTD
jgi:hypothetical protein